ncbi:MAG: hypothetical protein ACLQJR_21305 [Stellaceae bacterium]
MNDERTGSKRRPREQERELQTAREQRRDEPERKPDQAKKGEWRGSGVCGDRHTD